MLARPPGLTQALPWAAVVREAGVAHYCLIPLLRVPPMSPDEDFSLPVAPLMVLQPKPGQLGPGEVRGTSRQRSG